MGICRNLFGKTREITSSELISWRVLTMWNQCAARLLRSKTRKVARVLHRKKEKNPDLLKKETYISHCIHYPGFGD